ncbi:MAG: ferritin-like domain-containing protein [Minicystis sp.]
MSSLASALKNLVHAGPLFREATESGNLRVLASFLGPAFRGLIQRRGKGRAATVMEARYGAGFTLDYLRDHPEMARLYEAAKSSQWNAATDIPWSRAVDPEDPDHPLLPDTWVNVSVLPDWQRMTPKERDVQRHAQLSWLLSQFLHGEQGALFAAAQVTEAVPWLDAKLYGSTQVVDEGRHVEVFHTYLTKKLGKLYEIDDNLYVVIDALMSDARWDMKFLGMQIMIEGLALGAFGAIRRATREPLLKQILQYVITDEARHVHYGVLALGEHYAKALTEKERREREDWAFEVSLLLRNRFLAHELHDELWSHRMSRRAWDEMMSSGALMGMFRQVMFKRIVPNLKRIGLLSDRIRPKYAELGLLAFEHGRSADQLTAADLLEDG